MTIDHSADPNDLIDPTQDPLDDDEDELEFPEEEARYGKRNERRNEAKARGRGVVPPPMPAAEQVPTTEQLSSFVESEQRATIERQKGHLENLIAQLDQSESSLKRAQARFDSQIADRDEVIKRQDKIIEEVTRLAAREKELVAELDLANDRESQYVQRIEAMAQDDERLRLKIDQLVSDSNAQAMEISSMSKRMAALVRMRDTAQRDMASYKTQAIELKLQRDEARAHVEELTEHRKLPVETAAEGPEVLPERLMTWLRVNAPGMPLEDPVAELETILNGSLSMFKTAWPIIAKQVEDVMRQFGKMGWDFKQGKVPLCLGGHCTTNGHTMQPYQCSKWEPKLSPDH